MFLVSIIVFLPLILTTLILNKYILAVSQVKKQRYVEGQGGFEKLHSTCMLPPHCKLPTIDGLASHFAPFADLRLKSHLMGFRQTAHECATLACGLFPREDNQGPTDSRIAFFFTSLHYPKEFR